MKAQEERFFCYADFELVQTKVKWNVVFTSRQLKLLDTVRLLDWANTAYAAVLFTRLSCLVAQLSMDFHWQFVMQLNDVTVAAEVLLHFPVCQPGL